MRPSGQSQHDAPHKLVPLPASTRRLWDGDRAGDRAHPYYALSTFVAWSEGKGKYTPAKADAHAAAVKAIAARARQELAGRVLERRRLSFARHESQDRARHLRLVARTGLLVHFMNPGPLELGLALHRVYGFPFLPGSSLKGLMRATRQARDGEKAVADIYGSPDGVGAVAVLDGLPITPRVELDVMTPHQGQWYAKKAKAPSETDNPNPLQFLSVPAGSEFEVLLVATGDEGKVLDDAQGDLLEGVDRWGLGAKTAAGYGVMQGARVKSDSAARAPATPGQRTSALRQAESEADRRVAAIGALRPNQLDSMVKEHIRWCLQDPADSGRKRVAEAIVRRFEKKELKDRARRSPEWKQLLDWLGGK